MSLGTRPRSVRNISALAKVLLATGALVAAMSILTVGSSAAATPSCFGAAARDPKRPCFNPTRTVSPKLADLDRQPNSPCAPTNQKPEPVCTFGTPAAKAKGHIALIGDSHAVHWRAALDVVTRTKRWQGHSITAPGCFFSAAVDAMYEGAREPCKSWYRSALAWFADHPEVSTVFVSQNADTPIVVGAGETSLDVKIAGFRRAWQTLPKTVKHVIVLRDTPVSSQATFDCVRRVIRAGKQRPGPVCALSRSVAMKKDAAVSAVLRLRSKRYQYIDLTRFFCGPRSCYPVIGGAMVNRDIFGHITLAYSRTLGPYVFRKVRWLMAAW